MRPYGEQKRAKVAKIKLFSAKTKNWRKNRKTALRARFRGFREAVGTEAGRKGGPGPRGARAGARRGGFPAPEARFEGAERAAAAAQRASRRGQFQIKPPKNSHGLAKTRLRAFPAAPKKLIPEWSQPPRGHPPAARPGARLRGRGRPQKHPGRPVSALFSAKKFKKNRKIFQKKIFEGQKNY